MTGGALRFVGTSSDSEGLEALKGDEFDAVVICLPTRDMSAQQLCAQLRAVTNQPVVVLAPEPDVDTIVAVLKWGADECLSLSLSTREMVTHLRAQMRRASEYARPTEQPEHLEVGPLHVDLARHQVALGERPIELTPKEFDILAYLAHHPGRVVPRAELVEAVWGQELSPTSRSLDVHVGRLRQKIESDPRNPELLATVPGVGYCLQVE